MFKIEICFLYPRLSQLGYGSIYMTCFPLVKIVLKEWSGSTNFARLLPAAVGAGHGSPAKQNYIISYRIESKPDTRKRLDTHKSVKIHVRNEL